MELAANMRAGVCSPLGFLNDTVWSGAPRPATRAIMADQWFYSRNGQKSGPVSLGELRRLAASGGLSPDDQIWKEGMISWTPAGSVKALFATAAAEKPAAGGGAPAGPVATPASSAPAPRGPMPAGSSREPSMPAVATPRAAEPASASPRAAQASSPHPTPSHAAETQGLHPFLVGLALCLFFPLGFFLLARHPVLKHKKAWWAGGAAWALLVLLSPRSPSEDSTAPPETPGHNHSDTTAEKGTVSPKGGENAARDKPKGMYAIGDTFTLGDFTYTINNVTTRRAIGTSAFGTFMGETASPGATFVIVSYTMENVGRESQTVLSDDFQIQDGSGRTFKPSSKANVALLTESDDKDFLLSELQPGLPRAMQQAFELPEKALDAPVTIVVPQKGFFASGQAKVKVSVR